MQINETRGIVLTGMPGAGKSTIGVLLAKEQGLDFVDSDILIQVQAGKTLQRLVDEAGYEALRRIEEQVLLSVDPRGRVLATGGSAVYSEAAMQHLKQSSPIIWLRVPLDTLRQRIHNYHKRGIARRPEQSFEELFEERELLYARYADIVIDAGQQTPVAVVAAICRQLTC